MKKIVVFLSVIILICSISCSVFATTTYTITQVSEGTSKDKVFNSMQGKVVNKIIKIDPNERKIEGEISFSNDFVATDLTSAEIFIMISESIVLNEDFEEYQNYVKTFCEKVLEKDLNAKIGIVGIKGRISSSKQVGDKLFFDSKDEGGLPGRADDAEIVVNLTSNINQIVDGLKNMNTEKTLYRHNLQAAVDLAKKSYSSSGNKILISLYDNVPSICNGVASNVQGGTAAEVEKAVIKKLDTVVLNTKKSMTELKNSGVSFILLRPDDSSYDQRWYNSSTGEKILDFDGSNHVRELYGTLENPNFGKMYSLNNDSLEKIVTDYIYQDILTELNKILENVSVDVDFNEINKYFYIVTESEKYSETGEIENSDSSIIRFVMPKLKRDEYVKVKYTMTLNNDNCEEIVDKIVSLNTMTIKTDKYGDLDVESPKIKVSVAKADGTGSGGDGGDGGSGEGSYGDSKVDDDAKDQDDTIAPGKYPFTGYIVIMASGIIVLTIIAAFCLKKNIEMRDVK